MFCGSDELHVRDVPRPIPGDDDLLIKVHAAGLSTVMRAMSGRCRCRPDLDGVTSMLDAVRDDEPGRKLITNE